MFGHKANESGFAGGATSGLKFWIYILPLGFLLTMYTITGYDASAHISEETHGAERLLRAGHLALGPLLGDLRLDRAAGDHLRDPEEPPSRNLQSRLPRADDLHLRAQLGSRQGRRADLDRRSAVLRGGVRHERLAHDVRLLARRRRPRAQPVAPPGPSKTPTWAVFFVCLFAIVVTVPAYFPNHLGTPVAFLAVTSISVIGLYIAYTIPVFLRWRTGERFVAGTWTLGRKYKWINPIAVRVGGAVRDHLLPALQPRRGPVGKRVQLVCGQLRADRHDRDDPRGDDLVHGLGEKDVQGPDPHDRRARRRTVAPGRSPRHHDGVGLACCAVRPARRTG